MSIADNINLWFRGRVHSHILQPPSMPVSTAKYPSIDVFVIMFEDPFCEGKPRLFGMPKRPVYSYRLVATTLVDDKRFSNEYISYGEQASHVLGLLLSQRSMGLEKDVNRVVCGLEIAINEYLKSIKEEK